MSQVSFGEWLQRRRKAQDLTQEQLALQIHCSASALRKIESEQRRPSAQIVEQLAEVFHVAPTERKSFLKFARGNWEAAPAEAIEDAPWLVLRAPENEREDPSNPKIHLTTFLFTDIEGSTKLWESAPEKMKVALQRHHEILQEAISSNGGTAFQIVGDAFCAAFPTASSAIYAALTAQRRLHQEQWDLPDPIRVRMGIHTGTAEQTSNDSLTGGYASNRTLNRVSRILGAGHGGQVLLSLATRELITDSLPANTELRDMGEHHLKNLTRPEHLFQLNGPDLPANFPSLNTSDSTRHNLPLQLTSFIGREREIAEVKYLFSATRLLTLVGPGGTGKTRLSIQVASELLDQYPEGVWFVELAPISDSLLVASTTAAALNLPAEVYRPAIDMLCDYLRERELLLILDNCEHLVEACAYMVDRLLHAAPKLRIIASSREAFGIAGEASYRVPSLGLPDLKNLASFEYLNQYESVRLFIDRATSAVSTFRVTNENASAIAQICHRLDGIPLAIELAAAKVRALSVDQISKRLDDRFRLLTSGNRTALERHQTLRAALDWSHNLLSHEEQILFRRLSVFVNGWTLEAAEVVCSDESTSGRVRSEDILNLLEHLVNKSLASAEEWQNETRYRMLETMRQYADEKLIEAGESEYLRDQHLEYFLHLAETASPHLIRPEQVEWLARLDIDYENLRCALDWSLRKKSSEPALRLCAALGGFWNLRCYWLEGSHWLEHTLSKSAQNSSNRERTARVKVLYQDAELAGNLDNLKRMKASAEMSLALAQEGTDKRDTAIARFYVGFAISQGNKNNDEDAFLLIEQSLADFQGLDDPFWLSVSYGQLDKILATQGKLKGNEGTERILRILELANKAGERLNLAEALTSYAHFLYSSDQVNEARKYVEQADSLYKQLGLIINNTSFFIAELAWLKGEYDKAQTLYIRLREHFGMLGEKNTRSMAMADLGNMILEQGDVKQAQVYIEESLAIALEINNQAFIADRLAELGAIFYLQGNLEKSKQNFKESIALSKKVGNPRIRIFLSYLNTIGRQKLENSTQILGSIHEAHRANIKILGPLYRHQYDRAETYARDALGSVAFETTFAKGEKVSLDEALDLALEVLETM